MAKPRTFDPKPNTPGARIAWTHLLDNGTRLQREGTVWSLAPLVRGNCAAVWVTPDEPYEGDVYPPAVVVCVPNRTARVYAGGGVFRNGEAFSETSALSPTGSLALVAYRSAVRAASAA